MQKIKFGKYTIDHDGIIEEKWPERDRLPTKDPIGDTDDPMESHRLDALRYMSLMKHMVLIPEGKDFTLPDLKGKFLREVKTEYKCNCGTFAVHGNVPVSGHAHYCDLKKKDLSI